MVECYKIKTTKDKVMKNFLHKINSVSENSTWLFTDQIERICVPIDINDDSYLSPVPNLYHY